jgi:hypothetical protein
MSKILFKASFIFLATTCSAFSQSCNDLYIERNEIYKEGGFCFKTNRAINTFGNEGCRYDNINDVPLSRNDRARVSELRRLENRFGCR